MASRIVKAERAEARAYADHVSAAAAVIDRQLSGIEDAETARLRRRAGAYHAQWMAAARRLEELTEESYA